MDREKERAENSAARESRLADALIGDRADALEQARARVEILTPLAIDLPKTALPGSRELVAFTRLRWRSASAICSDRCHSRYAVRNASRSAAPMVRAKARCYA